MTTDLRTPEDLTAGPADANAKGWLGQAVDPTADENYSAGGVTTGEPTPESDETFGATVRAEVDRRQGKAPT